MKMQPFESQEERLWQNKDRPWLLYKDTLAKNFFGKNCSVGFGAQFFTSLKEDLCQDINRGFAFSKCLNGTFP